LKILVTGATGFIGSNLMQHLKQKKYTVHGLSFHKTDKKNIFSIPLSKPTALQSHFQKNKYDIVIHLAASIEENSPLKLFNINCQYTLNLLEVCRTYKIKKFIFTSSHAIYDKTNYLPIDEEHNIRPSSNYAISKLISEEICKMFYNYYGLKIIILRLSSVYGKNQPIKYLIPKLIDQCLNQKKIVLHKYQNGFQLMDLIHVEDVCRALELSIKSKLKFGVFNIASGNPVTVKNLVDIISKITNTKIINIKNIKALTNHFYYDVSKSKNQIGFKIKNALSIKTLKPIVNYYSK